MMGGMEKLAPPITITHSGYTHLHALDMFLMSLV